MDFKGLKLSKQEIIVIQFLSGEEKPNFVEVGPFVYQQSMHKTNINFSQDGEEITHSVYREFFFTESLSVSSDETYVIGKSNF